MRTAFGRFPLPPEIAAAVGSRHLLARAGPGDRPGLRQLAMARHAGIGRPAVDVGSHAGWSVLWASVVRQPTHLTLTGHTDTVHAVTAVPGPSGRMLLASGSTDGTVRLWDPVTGTPATDTAVSVVHIGVGVLTLCPLPHGRLAVGTTEGVTVLVIKALAEALPSSAR